MPKINDISINIGKDKVRTGVIFLIGFLAGGTLSSFALKSRLKKSAQSNALNYIENVYNDSSRIAQRASDAMDDLIKKTKSLEEAVNAIEEDHKIGFKYYEK